MTRADYESAVIAAQRRADAELKNPTPKNRRDVIFFYAVNALAQKLRKERGL